VTTAGQVLDHVAHGRGQARSDALRTGVSGLALRGDALLSTLHLLDLSEGLRDRWRELRLLTHGAKPLDPILALAVQAWAARPLPLRRLDAVDGGREKRVAKLGVRSGDGERSIKQMIGVLRAAMRQ